MHKEQQFLWILYSYVYKIIKMIKVLEKNTSIINDSWHYYPWVLNLLKKNNYV